MKKLALVMAAFFVAFSLAACVGAKRGNDQVRVKCPACGYEFDAPTRSGGE